MNNIISSTGIKYGIWGGILSIAVSLVSILIGFSPETMTMNSIVSGLSSIVIVCGLIYLTLRDIRSHQNYLTLGQALLGGTLTCLVAGLIAGIFSYVYNNFIDPSYLTEMANVLSEFYADQGFNEEMTSAMVEGIEKSRGVSNIVMSSLGYGAVGLIVALVAGLIMKREEDRL